MSESDWLVDRFEAHRAHVRAVAYRMLGSGSEADDTVQETWFRLSRSDTSAVQNLGGWLTTVVARVSLDMFAVPFDEIGAIVGRSSNAAKFLSDLDLTVLNE